MTDKIIEAATACGIWVSMGDDKQKDVEALARFYAIARNQALEDAATLAEEWKTDWAHSLDVAEKIRELKAKL